MRRSFVFCQDQQEHSQFSITPKMRNSKLALRVGIELGREQYILERGKVFG